MVILPAIDIHQGKCVRLYQGDYATAQQVAADPVETAVSFREAGAEWVHMVDLDGAKSGSLINREIFLAVAKQCGLPIELGGGIRDMQSVEYYLSNGIARVILGSAAIRDPAFVKEAVAAFGDKIAVGIDAKNGKAAASGWLEESELNYIDLARAMEQIGVRTIIYTDIAKDGTLSGPNIEQLEAINAAVSCDIIASGGIHNIEDIKALSQKGMYGAICGKSIYQGTLDLKEAIAEGRRVG
ncbi:MAG: 1-(5-phosphoribosyl)-5-[(5-phosphoribosylamino)methylideneamino]imidazole-4-carboxamide isomerase [Clostridiales bacterium]|nr:1-(5-phosphoribosyl)-5-[(5-phosphoribosylamino)methylideneamino]imidazole-4-carboxamide isomerase [Clostridiales bacterium]